MPPLPSRPEIVHCKPEANEFADFMLRFQAGEVEMSRYREVDEGDESYLFMPPGTGHHKALAYATLDGLIDSPVMGDISVIMAHTTKYMANKRLKLQQPR